MSPLSLPILIPHPPRSTLFPYTTLFRSELTLRSECDHRSITECDTRALSTVSREFGHHPCPCPIPREPADIAISEHPPPRSEEHTSELQSRGHLVCRLLLEKKKQQNTTN